MFAVLQGQKGVWLVGIVKCPDVDHIHIFVGHQGFIVGVGLRDMIALGKSLGFAGSE